MLVYQSVNLPFSHGFSYFPLVFPWFSYGFPMVFLFSHGFPTVFGVFPRGVHRQASRLALRHEHLSDRSEDEAALRGALGLGGLDRSKKRCSNL